MTVHGATEALFWAAIIGIVLFFALYATLARWWRSWQGWYNMLLTVALLGLAGLGLLSRVHGPDYLHDDLFRMAVYAIVVIVIWWRLILFIRVQVIERYNARNTMRRRS